MGQTGFFPLCLRNTERKGDLFGPEISPCGGVERSCLASSSESMQTGEKDEHQKQCENPPAFSREDAPVHIHCPHSSQIFRMMGEKITSATAGKMNATSGKSSFTAAFWAAASAR